MVLKLYDAFGRELSTRQWYNAISMLVDTRVVMHSIKWSE